MLLTGRSYTSGPVVTRFFLESKIIAHTCLPKPMDASDRKSWTLRPLVKQHQSLVKLALFQHKNKERGAEVYTWMSRYYFVHVFVAQNKAYQKMGSNLG